MQEVRGSIPGRGTTDFCTLILFVYIYIYIYIYIYDDETRSSLQVWTIYESIMIT